MPGPRYAGPRTSTPIASCLTGLCGEDRSERRFTPGHPPACASRSQNRVGGAPPVGAQSSHTTVRAVRYTAVPRLSAEPAGNEGGRGPAEPLQLGTAGRPVEHSASRHAPACLARVRPPPRPPTADTEAHKGGAPAPCGMGAPPSVGGGIPLARPGLCAVEPHEGGLEVLFCLAFRKSIP